MKNASAFILIGGKSRRFGSPKWQALLNNETVLNRIWEKLNLFENRAVIGKTKPERFNKPFINDKLNLDAPINGLFTALKYSRTDWSFIISCDLPLISSTVISQLYSQSLRNNENAIIPYSENQLQVTCGFYHKNCLSKLETQIKLENYSLHSFINMLALKEVVFLDSIPFWNMNTEKDYQNIVKYLSTQPN